MSSEHSNSGQSTRTIICFAYANILPKSLHRLFGAWNRRASATSLAGEQDMSSRWVWVGTSFLSSFGGAADVAGAMRPAAGACSRAAAAAASSADGEPDEAHRNGIAETVDR